MAGLWPCFHHIIFPWPHDMPNPNPRFTWPIGQFFSHQPLVSNAQTAQLDATWELIFSGGTCFHSAVMISCQNASWNRTPSSLGKLYGFVKKMCTPNSSGESPLCLSKSFLGGYTRCLFIFRNQWHFALRCFGISRLQQRTWFNPYRTSNQGMSKIVTFWVINMQRLMINSSEISPFDDPNP